jgi:predicted RNA methylase
MIWWIVLAVALFLYGLWLLVPILTGLPWRPTQPERVRKALKLANVQPGERVYDLGSGDGRILLIAAREFGAQAIGVEISPLHCLLTWVQAHLQGLGGQVRVRWESFYRTDLHDADVVVAYMTSQQAIRLQPQLQSQLKDDTRVVTISFDFDGWEPVQVDRTELIFAYHMPPTQGSLESFLAKDNEHGF